MSTSEGAEVERPPALELSAAELKELVAELRGAQESGDQERLSDVLDRLREAGVFEWVRADEEFREKLASRLWSVPRRRRRRFIGDLVAAQPSLAATFAEIKSEYKQARAEVVMLILAILTGREFVMDLQAAPNRNTGAYRVRAAVSGAVVLLLTGASGWFLLNEPAIGSSLLVVATLAAITWWMTIVPGYTWKARTTTEMRSSGARQQRAGPAPIASQREPGLAQNNAAEIASPQVTRSLPWRVALWGWLVSGLVNAAVAIYTGIHHEWLKLASFTTAALFSWDNSAHMARGKEPPYQAF